jgi:predicted  nucleic acid-binding Zn-ribbon protein
MKYDESSARTVVCADCGKEFTAYHGLTKICEDCKMERARVRQREHYRRKKEGLQKQPNIKICVICGKEFVAKRSDALTCSPDCYKERNRIWNRERGAEKERRRRALLKQRKQRKPKEQPALSFSEILKIADEYHLTYGKTVEAINQGKIKVERKKTK